jgi:hypothetical protein
MANVSIDPRDPSTSVTHTGISPLLFCSIFFTIVLTAGASLIVPVGVAGTRPVISRL